MNNGGRDFNIKKTLQYYDSANIAESYTGIVKPLTQSFASLVYEQVYKDLLRMSGVSAKKIEHHSRIFENLLGFFYGRMYYNMNNWYLMAAFVPGYRRNKENFETMITSNVKQEITTTIKPSLIFILVYPLIVIAKASVFGFTSRYFKYRVTRELYFLRNQDFGKLKYKECTNLFKKINHDLLRKWYITVENDFFVMTYLGILKKLLNEQSLQKVIIFHSKATEQVNALNLLSKRMSKIEKLWNAIETNNTEKFNTELEHHPEVKSLFENYLLTFGGRFANELKLESVGIDEDRTKLFSVLRAYKNFKLKIHPAPKALQLPFLRRVLVKIILAEFKKYGSRREEFRLLRSNTFGVARLLFSQIGSILVENDELQNRGDIFYLKMEEFMTSSAVKNNDLKQLVKERKRIYLSYESVLPPTYFATSGNLSPEINPAAEFEDNFIKARPASAGIIKGRVKVFKEFFMPKKIDFDILVTSHTDPGWTSLIALSKGLIIENGGVLSHASIVARELNIPAVIGATNAVAIFKDGQIVEIDGSTGVIKII